MITVRYAEVLKGKLLVDFEASGLWKLKPGNILRSGNVTVKFLKAGMNRMLGDQPVYSFLGESDFPPEALIGKEFEVIQ